MRACTGGAIINPYVPLSNFRKKDSFFLVLFFFIVLAQLEGPELVEAKIMRNPDGIFACPLLRFTEKCIISPFLSVLSCHLTSTWS